MAGHTISGSTPGLASSSVHLLEQVSDPVDGVAPECGCICPSATCPSSFDDNLDVLRVSTRSSARRRFSPGQAFRRGCFLRRPSHSWDAYPPEFNFGCNTKCQQKSSFRRANYPARAVGHAAARSSRWLQIAPMPKASAKRLLSKGKALTRPVADDPISGIERAWKADP